MRIFLSLQQTKMKLFTQLFIFFLFLTAIATTFASPHEKHFINHPTGAGEEETPKQYFEINRPLTFTNQFPACTLQFPSFSFGNTNGLPPATAAYSPPAECCWTNVVLEFSADCKSDQLDRVAAVWLAGVELLRSNTPQPGSNGASWKITKDITKYSALLETKDLNLAVMLENSVDDVFTGVFEVNISFVYYDSRSVGSPPSTAALRGCADLPAAVDGNPIALKVNDGHPIALKVNDRRDPAITDDGPADSIIPVSSAGEHGHWLLVQNDVQVLSKEIEIPKNTYKAVIEVYATSHANDEFWYSHPPDSYIKTNNLDAVNGKGAYREVLVTIDSNLVGTFVPFPVIYAGGINPMFWDPVVSIGAFSVPSYEIDLTPFLGLLLDGKPHRIGFGVANCVPYWLLGGNLHLWLEYGTEKIEAGVIETEPPKFELELENEFKGLDGKFEVEMKRKSKFSGWVKSRKGNLTTTTSQELKFENEIKYEDDATKKKIEQKTQDEIETKITDERGQSISQTKVKRKFPLEISTKTESKKDEDTSSLITELENEWYVKVSGDFNSKLSNKQECSGSLEVKGNYVLSGQANTKQKYTYKDDDQCYSRKVSVADTKLVDDNADLLCSSTPASTILSRKLLFGLF